MLQKIKNISKTVLTSLIVFIVGVFVLYNYVPLSVLEIPQEQKLGATVTTILATDKLSDSRGVINTNFANLNSDKIETSTTTLPLINTLANLTTTGTIGTGVWQGTAVADEYGGTGQTTYATGDLLYASASNVLSKLTASSTGEVLTIKAGGVLAWADAVVNEGIPYSWTALHTFSNGIISNASSTMAILNTTTFTLNGTSTAPLIDGVDSLADTLHTHESFNYSPDTATTTDNYYTYQIPLIEDTGLSTLSGFISSNMTALEGAGGAMQLSSTGAATTKSLIAGTGSTDYFAFNSGKNIRVKFRAKWTGVASADDGAIGLNNNVSCLAGTETNVSDCIWFHNAGGTLFASNGSGTGNTNTDISSGITVANWNTYEIIYDGSKAEFYVNGTLEATHTTNLPDGLVVSFGAGLSVTNDSIEISPIIVSIEN